MELTGLLRKWSSGGSATPCDMKHPLVWELVFWGPDSAAVSQEVGRGTLSCLGFLERLLSRLKN